MDNRTLHCLRGHEWEITLSVLPGTREMPEERTCADEDLICAECGLGGYEGKPDISHYREIELQLRYCPMCERIYNPATGATEDFDVEPKKMIVCDKCKFENPERAARLSDYLRRCWQSQVLQAERKAQ